MTDQHLHIDKVKPAEKKMRHEAPTGRALIYLFLITVVLLSLMKIQDTDVWMHLSFGRLIMDLNGIPDKEMFIYPAAEMPFYYTSWLFSVITYIVYQATGAIGLVTMKAIVLATAVMIVLMDSLKPARNVTLAVVISSIIVMVSYSRFALRPEIFAMAFLAFTVYSLNSYLYSGKKYIYSLPVIALIWANMHSSIIIMFYVFGAFIAGSLIQNLLAKKAIGTRQFFDARQIKHLLAIATASLIASLLNPNFFTQHLLGPNVLSTEFFMKNIVELLPPAGLMRQALYAMDILILFSFALNRKKFSLSHLLLVLPFMYLPFVSVRFVALLAIAGGAILIRNLSEYLSHKDWSAFVQGRPATAVSALWIVLFCTLTLLHIQPFGLGKQHFGFEFDESRTPKGAVRYMKERDIHGRVLNTFEYGQYIIWNLYPDATVFIDGRGYIPKDAIKEFQAFRESSSALSAMQERYGFDAILVRFPLIKYLVAGDSDHAVEGAMTRKYVPFSAPGWALVYWDDKSMLLLKRGGKFESAIKADQYQSISPDVHPSELFNNVTNRPGRALILELQRNVKETDSSLANTLLGLYYNSIGEHKKALASFQRVREGAEVGILDLKYIAHTLSGDSYHMLGDQENSLFHFKEASRIMPDGHYSLALAYYRLGDNKNASIHFKEYIKHFSDGQYANNARTYLSKISN